MINARDALSIYKDSRIAKLEKELEPYSDLMETIKKGVIESAKKSAKKDSTSHVSFLHCCFEFPSDKFPISLAKALEEYLVLLGYRVDINYWVNASLKPSIKNLRVDFGLSK